MPSTPSAAPHDAVAALRETWPDLPWQHLTTAHGAFHQVLLLPPVAAIRIRTGRGHREQTVRELSTAAALADAGLPVPRPLRSPASGQDWSAATVEHVDGDGRDPRSWAEDRGALLTVLERWGAAGAAHPELAEALPAARAWCGGARWPELVEEITAGDQVAREAARQRIDAVLAGESEAEAGVVHGDFGLHNLLWGRDGEPRLIDTDHAAWADPAIDLAPLLANYPRDQLAADLPSDLLERASAHRRTLSLQVAAAAELSGDPALRDHALANFSRRIRSGDPQW